MARDKRNRSMMQTITIEEPEAPARGTLIKQREANYGANMLTPTETAIVKTIATSPSWKWITRIARDSSTRNHATVLALAGLNEKGLVHESTDLPGYHRLTAKGWQWAATYLPNQNVIG